MAEGKAEGISLGKAEGLFTGKAESVLAVLTARGFAPTEAQKARVLAWSDLARLDRALLRAVTASSAEDALSD